MANAASLARNYISAGALAAQGGSSDLGATRASGATETVDGLWLSAHIDASPRTLSVGAHTALQLRLVLATRPATPLAIELAFNGTLTVSSASLASGVLVQGGSLNGILAIGLVQEDQPAQKTTEFLLTERFNWAVVLRSSGDSANGSVSLDLRLDAKASTLLRITKNFAGNGAQIAYLLAIVLPGAPGAPEQVFPLGQYVLGADASLADPNNAYHQYALHGLDMVQAALLISEPELKAQALALLFPAADAGTPELVIQAVRDWVAFTRRRERHCAVEVVPAAPPAPRRYRVIERSFDSLDLVKSDIANFEQALKDPLVLAKQLQTWMLIQEREEKLRLVLSFAGGTATASSDMAAAASDWKSFLPGLVIAYAAVGAVGETDAGLQLDRLRTFETAISGSSKEAKGTVVDALIPYPDAAVPDDADGVMLLFTVTPTVTRRALMIYGGWDRPNHFLNREAPFGPLQFINNAPQGTALLDFIKNLTPNQPVLGVTLATTKAAPDVGAPTRLASVMAALALAGRPAVAASRQTVEALNANDRAQLTDILQKPDDFDEVIFFELNAGT